MTSLHKANNLICTHTSTCQIKCLSLVDTNNSFALLDLQVWMQNIDVIMRLKVHIRGW